jgi:peptide subunit release factor 1 (eRF1)
MNRPAPVPPIEPSLFDAEGPFISVYLSTPGALPDAAEQVALRWRNLRRQLAEDGAPEAALGAVDPLTERAYTEGESLAVVAHARGVLYSAHLPQPPEDDVAVVGELPHLTPLLAVMQRLLPHIVVVTDRLGAELIVVQPDDADRRTTVEGEQSHVTRSAPGGWSQRRFQQRAENRWDGNAREVADHLTRLVDAHHPRLVVVSGDVRAVQFLRGQLPARVSALLAEVQGDYSDLEEALRRTDELVAARADTETGGMLQALARELGQDALAAAGAEATLRAVAAGQVDTVLLDPTRMAGRRAFYDPASAQTALRRDDLAAVGVTEPQSSALEDVVVRSALVTGAAVRIVPAGTTELGDDGVAALLRYR